ncbi:MAG: pyridoxal-phosphate dependent enzyme [gamma proteobacterium symbiont of Phacoides pectinatus]
MIHPRTALATGLNQHSRIHPLRGFGDGTIYIKREDELSAGVTGTKLRKYLSILPAIEARGIDRVVMIGSARSNNLVGLGQLLVERGIAVEAFIKRPGDPTPTGNLLFLRMLLPHEAIHLVAPQEWGTVNARAAAHARRLESRGGRVLVVPEGGDCREALPGILTLAGDLLRNELECGIRFDDIWIDSGTGISAIGLLLGLRLQQSHPRRIHITLIAGDREAFIKRYRRFERWCAALHGGPLPEPGLEPHFHRPATAASFGSVNAGVLEETRRIAREAGILVDPVYSAKHLYTVRQQLRAHPPTRPQLVIYGGGPLGLCGFQSRLTPGLEAPHGGGTPEPNDIETKERE